MTIQHTLAAYPAGHPFHDPREWEGPYAIEAAAERIGAGDLVRVDRGATSVIVVAHERDRDGNWRDASSALILSAFGRLRPHQFWLVPSPGPEPLPIEPGRFIRAVTAAEGSTAEWLTLGLDGFFYGPFDAPADPETGEEQVAPWRAEPIEILAFTDEDGTAWSRQDAASAWTEVQA